MNIDAVACRNGVVTLRVVICIAAPEVCRLYRTRVSEVIMSSRIAPWAWTTARVWV